MNFSDFSFHPSLFEGISAMHFEQATPIQEKAIPIIIEGKDLIACAQTGTGKTAAYLLPVIHKILEHNISGTNMLVIAPTRELAQQIDQQVEALAYFTGVSSIALYGGGDGAAWDQQKKAIQQGVEIIIATPGRLIALLTSAQINLKNIKHLVLDEADRMLDMGFNDDIMRIVSYLPENRQTLLFSATMPPKIRTLAKTILKNPFEINIAISKPAEGILQQAYLVYDSQKVALATHLLKNKQYNSIIIFASTKEKVKELDRTLKREGIPCYAFHSDLEQPEREELMRQFKNKKISTLVATDVISRGIDVVGIDLVINFDVPPDPEDYIHRIGRTARAESTGTAITFVNEADQPKFFRIENLIGKEISKVPTPEYLGSSPLYQPELKRKTNFRNDKFKKKFRKK
ncbi:MAG: DEAD/DEAH box helicase [Bacteroidetes bacterium]|nr:DEAD/DEAH box helicase [Bacteroidota bacterium]MBV6461646.1 ATP-dependent RNA helicase CshA [Flavobacteriales bacterium]WKZ74124.1 MAG: DEAD/DEAH box helicase [Vicingaceae bacterium]MCL4816797.1 DEAD/DEAH box helicase [Flavobacteriales bacterium]NOG95735.1 DEAD/DEAH box helicase [Bacteroidota bacterium]